MPLNYATDQAYIVVCTPRHSPLVEGEPLGRQNSYPYRNNYPYDNYQYNDNGSCRTDTLRQLLPQLGKLL